jgi:hypothetical protein
LVRPEIRRLNTGMSTMVAPRDMTVDRIFATVPQPTGPATSTAYPVHPPVRLRAGQVAEVQINPDGTASLIVLEPTPIYDGLVADTLFMGTR